MDARTLAICATVCRQWRVEARLDTLWRPILENEASGIVYSTPICTELPVWQQVQLLRAEARRTAITVEELTSFTWIFTFNENVEEYWKRLDPHWTGSGPLMRRYFLANGLTLAADDDPLRLVTRMT
ncbi:hypothetical protein ACKKBG_A24300 [Auxenochlorella protothecoides x Auxenochlorella symbiontica]